MDVAANPFLQDQPDTKIRFDPVGDTGLEECGIVKLTAWTLCGIVNRQPYLEDKPISGTSKPCLSSAIRIKR
jgi:hypothetical protein